MLRMACIAASAALLFSADVPQIVLLQPPASNHAEIPLNQSLHCFQIWLQPRPPICRPLRLRPLPQRNPRWISPHVRPTMPRPLR